MQQDKAKEKKTRIRTRKRRGTRTRTRRRTSARSCSVIINSFTTGSFKAEGVVSSSINWCASVAMCAALSRRLRSVIFHL